MGMQVKPVDTEKSPANEPEVFKALGDLTRLRIMRLLVVGGEALCVCEIVDALKLPQHRISKHLLVLRNAGLVEVEREGTWAYYRPGPPDERNRLLFDFLRTYLRHPVFNKDGRRLERRLSLREAGKCVVGFGSRARSP
jgi:ArsR family transcriptional regulator, arsenate/arsenite/antimonite-responsive transcriptional repressor